MAIALSKETERRVNLAKESARTVILTKGLDVQKSQVKFVLDISGSMRDLLLSGTVQKVCERVLGLALNFDDDGEAEVYPFHNKTFRHPNAMSLANIEGFVDREIMRNYSLGSTKYAPFINMLLEDSGFVANEVDTGGLVNSIKGFFGKKVEADPSSIQTIDLPSYVIVITDGDNDYEDKAPAEEAIKKASKFGMFFQFVGIGNASFSFLEKLDNMGGRFMDNANFFQANDIDKIENKELYSRMLHEYPDWLKEAKSKQLIK